MADVLDVQISKEYNIHFSFNTHLSISILSSTTGLSENILTLVLTQLLITAISWRLACIQLCGLNARYQNKQKCSL